MIVRRRQSLGAVSMSASDYENNANVLASSSGSQFVFVGFSSSGQATVTPASSADELAGIYSSAADSTKYIWGGMYRTAESSSPIDSFVHAGTLSIASFFDKLKDPWVLGAGAVLLGAIVLWSNKGAFGGKKKRRKPSRRAYARARRRSRSRRR